MNVLWIVHYPVYAGPHNRIALVAPLLKQHGINVTALVPREPGDAAARLRHANVDVVELPLGRLRNSRDLRLHLRLLGGFRRDVRRLRSVIRAKQIDVVMVAGLANPHGLVAGSLENVATIYQVVDTRTPAPLARVMLRLIDRTGRVVVFGGERLIAYHLGGRQLKAKSFVVRPCVDTQVFTASKERRTATRAKLGIPMNAPVVGTVANLNPQKGIEYFIRAADQIYAARQDAWFVIVGQEYKTHAAYAAMLRREAEAARLPLERVIFAGSATNTHDYYPAFDVKVIASVPHSEGTTTTAMEAMACGIPVVATDVGAVGEVVRHRETGLVVRPLDAGALADATLELLRAPQLRSYLGERARSAATSRHDVRQGAREQLAALRAATGPTTAESS